ncbi:MAG: MotA/TolQ/ExbB proton channel family protein [Proteobacteria bacterium]|nr:MotA/TolQ/ExbB proton channel family protein [Pseudomonadota bacterium]
MIRANIIGVAICAVIFIAAFLITGNAAAYLNVEACMVVVSGTFGAALLSYPYDHLKTAYYVAKGTYTHPGTDPDAVIGVLLDTAIRSRLDGLAAMEKAGEQTTMHFLRGALNMLADNYPEHEIRDILATEIHFFRTRRMQQERVFRSMATYAPAFGLAGSVIGLIGLLIGLGDTGEVLRFIPIALISTLYGILFGNFVLTPVAENIRGKTDREVLVQQLIIEGVCAIKTEANPHILEKRLTSFLTPASRRDSQENFAELRKKYVKIAQQRREAEELAARTAAGGASAKTQARR